MKSAILSKVERSIPPLGKLGNLPLIESDEKDLLGVGSETVGFVDQKDIAVFELAENTTDGGRFVSGSRPGAWRTGCRSPRQRPPTWSTCLSPEGPVSNIDVHASPCTFGQSNRAARRTDTGGAAYELVKSMTGRPVSHLPRVWPKTSRPPKSTVAPTGEDGVRISIGSGKAGRFLSPEPPFRPWPCRDEWRSAETEPLDG